MSSLQQGLRDRELFIPLRGQQRGQQTGYDCGSRRTFTEPEVHATVASRKPPQAGQETTVSFEDRSGNIQELEPC